MSGQSDLTSTTLEEFLHKKFVDFELYAKETESVADHLQLTVPEKREGTTKIWADAKLQKMELKDTAGCRAEWENIFNLFMEDTGSKSLRLKDVSTVPFKFPRTEDDVV